MHRHVFTTIMSLRSLQVTEINLSGNVIATLCTSIYVYMLLCYVIPLSPKSLLECITYEGVTKSFRNGRLGRELQMVQLSATRCSCIAILWVSLVSFAAITICVASQRVFIVVRVYFVIDSVRKLLDTLSYVYVPLGRIIIYSLFTISFQSH
jgi:hypothetical protein